MNPSSNESLPNAEELELAAFKARQTKKVLSAMGQFSPDEDDPTRTTVIYGADSSKKPAKVLARLDSNIAAMIKRGLPFFFRVSNTVTIVAPLNLDPGYKIPKGQLAWNGSNRLVLRATQEEIAAFMMSPFLGQIFETLKRCKSGERCYFLNSRRPGAVNWVIEQAKGGRFHAELLTRSKTPKRPIVSGPVMALEQIRGLSAAASLVH